MAKPEADEFGPLTPADMVQWLQQEVRDVTKASELRIQEATKFVTDFALGKISEEELLNRKSIYAARWGDETIPGVLSEEGMTNGEIMRRVDATLPRSVQESIRRLENSKSQGRKR
jgi:hypothetical protein